MSSAPLPPPAIITSTNHGPIVTIATACGMTFACLALIIRIYARLAINGPWSYDDTGLALATLFGVGQAIAKMIAVSDGLGKSIHLIDPAKLIRMYKSDYASDILYLVAVYFSKASACGLFLRLTPNKHHVMFCWGILGASSAWLVASILAVAIKCRVSEPWVVNAQCSGVLLRWQVIGAFDVITEAALFYMAVYLVVGLRMSFQLKAFVVSAFAFRLPVIAFVVLRLHDLGIDLSSSDYTFDAVLPSIWMVLQVNYSILASTIPCMKPFMVACNTGWGHAAPHTGDGSVIHGSNSSYGLRSMEKPHPRGPLSSLGDPHERSPNFRPDRCETRTAVERKPPATQAHERSLDHTPDEASQSIASNDSTQMIIRREVGWTVTYDDEPPSGNSPGLAPPQSDVEAQANRYAS